jgi:hypothetical protein
MKRKEGSMLVVGQQIPRLLLVRREDILSFVVVVVVVLESDWDFKFWSWCLGRTIVV